MRNDNTGLVRKNVTLSAGTAAALEAMAETTGLTQGALLELALGQPLMARTRAVTSPAGRENPFGTLFEAEARSGQAQGGMWEDRGDWTPFVRLCRAALECVPYMRLRKGEDEMDPMMVGIENLDLYLRCSLDETTDVLEEESCLAGFFREVRAGTWASYDEDEMQQKVFHLIDTVLQGVAMRDAALLAYKGTVCSLFSGIFTVLFRVSDGSLGGWGDCYEVLEAKGLVVSAESWMRM